MSTLISGPNPFVAGSRLLYDVSTGAGVSGLIRFILRTEATRSPQNINLSGGRPSGNIDFELFHDRNNNGIIDSQDVLVGRSALPGTAEDTIQARLRTPGSYIARYTNLAATRTNYAFRLTNTGSDPSNLLQGSLPQGNLAATPTVVRRGAVSASDTANLYQFTLAQRGNVNAVLTGLAPGTDVGLRLVRDSNNNGLVDAGEVVATTHVLGDQTPQINVQAVEAGSYFLQTFVTGDAISRYDLRMSNTGGQTSNLLATTTSAPVVKVDRTFYQTSHSLRPNQYTCVGAFALDQAGNLNIEVSRNGSSGFRLIYDRDFNGLVDATEVLYSSTENTGVRNLSFFNLPRGSYYFQSTLAQASPASTVVRVMGSGSEASPFLTPDFTTAGLTNQPYRRQDALGAANNTDTYRFQMTQTGNFNAALVGLAQGADVGLRLVRDANGNGRVDGSDVIATEYGMGNGDRAINHRLQAGQYFLQAFSKNGRPTNYNLALSSTRNAPSNLLPAEVNVGRLNSPVSHYGVMEPSNMADTYRFNLGSKRRVTLKLEDLNANADLRLIQDKNKNGVVDAGEEIARATALGSRSETLSTTLNAGDYFVQVYAPVNPSGPFPVESTAYSLNIL